MGTQNKRQKREEKLKTALKKLGAGRHKIAESLKKRRIKVPSHYGALDCPVAQYVEKVFPTCVEVEVDAGMVMVSFIEDNEDDEIVSVEFPKAVGDFIDSFDNGEYEFLREGSEDD